MKIKLPFRFRFMGMLIDINIFIARLFANQAEKLVHIYKKMHTKYFKEK